VTRFLYFRSNFWKENKHYVPLFQFQGIFPISKQAKASASLSQFEYLSDASFSQGSRFPLSSRYPNSISLAISILYIIDSLKKNIYIYIFPPSILPFLNVATSCKIKNLLKKQPEKCPSATTLESCNFLVFASCDTSHWTNLAMKVIADKSAEELAAPA